MFILESASENTVCDMEAILSRVRWVNTIIMYEPLTLSLTIYLLLLLEYSGKRVLVLHVDKIVAHITSLFFFKESDICFRKNLSMPSVNNSSLQPISWFVIKVHFLCAACFIMVLSQKYGAYLSFLRRIDIDYINAFTSSPYECIWNANEKDMIETVRKRAIKYAQQNHADNASQ